jgi:hypothetical protein
MNTKTPNVKAQSFIDSLSPEMRQVIIEISEVITPALDQIHSSPATTQNYYGDYFRILSHKPERAKILALAMLYAGANPSGIEAAVRLATGQA